MSAASTASIAIRPATDALIIVDMQNDFLLDDAPLRVPGGVALIEPINNISRQFRFRHQVATQDWHPRKHCSFQEQGGHWPPHCVRGSPGAALHASLRTDYFHSIIRKGITDAADSYSAFTDDSKQSTGLEGLLRSLGVTRVFVCGVAYDYCVFYTAVDAKGFGFEVVVLKDVCAAIDETTAQTRTTELQEAGVAVRESSALKAVE